MGAISSDTARGPWKRFWIFYALSLAFLGLVPLLSAFFGTSMDFGALAALTTLLLLGVGFAALLNQWNLLGYHL